MAFIAWRDNVWLSVQNAAEERITHDPEALIAELPPMTWPS
jgi:hypothetical protein